MNQHVDLKVSWQDCIPIFLAVLESGTAKGREQALVEMRRMAWMADNAFKPLELLFLPMSPAGGIGMPAAYYDVILRVVDGDVIEEHTEPDLEDATRHFTSLQERFPQAHIQDFRF